MKGGTGFETVTSCIRTNVVRGGSNNDNEYLRIRADFDLWDVPQWTTVLDEETCALEAKHVGAPPIAVTPRIGAGTTCMVDIRLNWNMQFRVGQVVAILNGDRGLKDRDKRNPTARQQLLAPAATAIAENLPA